MLKSVVAVDLLMRAYLAGLLGRKQAQAAVTSCHRQLHATPEIRSRYALFRLGALLQDFLSPLTGHSPVLLPSSHVLQSFPSSSPRQPPTRHEMYGMGTKSNLWHYVNHYEQRDALAIFCHKHVTFVLVDCNMAV